MRHEAEDGEDERPPDPDPAGAPPAAGGARPPRRPSRPRPRRPACTPPGLLADGSDAAPCPPGGWTPVLGGHPGAPRDPGRRQLRALPAPPPGRAQLAGRAPSVGEVTRRPASPARRRQMVASKRWSLSWASPLLIGMRLTPSRCGEWGAGADVAARSGRWRDCASRGGQGGRQPVGELGLEGSGGSERARPPNSTAVLPAAPGRPGRTPGVAGPGTRGAGRPAR